jgi:hypothetical protein
MYQQDRCLLRSQQVANERETEWHALDEVGLLRTTGLHTENKLRKHTLLPLNIQTRR